MIILGVDPGSARLGWGVIVQTGSEIKVGDYGCIQTPVGKTDGQRLVLLYDAFIKLLTKIKPDAVAIEDLFFFKNQTTIIKVAQARGVALLAAAKHAPDVAHYTPLQIKQAVTGYGRAEKKQMQLMVKSILKLSQIPKPDDTADALAVALTHAFTHKLKANILKS